jgi:hypothetical protein
MVEEGVYTRSGEGLKAGWEADRVGHEGWPVDGVSLWRNGRAAKREVRL